MIEGPLAAATITLALALDLAFGECRRGHPVAAIGCGLHTLERAWNKGSVRQQRRRGLMAWLLGVVAVGAVALAVESALAACSNALWVVLIGAATLKPAFSLRGLARAGGAVLEPLRAGDLVAARHALAWHLVSRDTSELREDEIAGAAIASLAENLVDSVIAPLFWYAVAGLPGAWIWRTINTADAMWGYRNSRFLFFGRTAARADDIGAWAAARLGAALIGLSALLSGRPINLASLHREAAKTPSPNGGWPMAAAALALGIRLDKRGVYTLHADGRRPTEADLGRARQALVVIGGVGALAIAGTTAFAR